MTRTTKGMVVITLLLFVGAATWLLYNQTDSETANKQPVAEETSEPTEIAEPEPTEQSYSNTELNISFMYPLDWQLLTCGDDDSVASTVYLASDDRGFGIQDGGDSILCGSGSDFSPQAAIFSRQSIDPPTGEVEVVLVSGVEAQKYVSVERADGAFLPRGFTTITYVIPRSDGSKLVAVYSQWPESVEGYDTSNASRGIFESIVENSLELEI